MENLREYHNGELPHRPSQFNLDSSTAFATKPNQDVMFEVVQEEVQNEDRGKADEVSSNTSLKECNEIHMNENEMEATKICEDKFEEPKLGMELDTANEAYLYYSGFGKENGFAVAKRSSTKGSDGNVRHVILGCSKGGKARMRGSNPIKPRPQTKKFKVCQVFHTDTVVYRDFNQQSFLYLGTPMPIQATTENQKLTHGKFPMASPFPANPPAVFQTGVYSLISSLNIWARVKYGMNFACGGTGVFNTLVLEPNMTTQLDFFQNLINELVYQKSDLQSSLALLTISGNDYGAYLSRGCGSIQDLSSFIPRVVNQLVVNLKQIHGMGIRKVAITALQPLGCLPQSTILNSFQQCNETENTAVDFHNMLLHQAVAKLNNESKDSAAFVILDLYGSFTKVLKNQGEYLGSVDFASSLKPCCIGVSGDYYCGSVDKKGSKLYTVCKNPGATFFWDMVHPTQAGWRAVYLSLKSSL